MRVQRNLDVEGVELCGNEKHRRLVMEISSELGHGR